MGDGSLGEWVTEAKDYKGIIVPALVKSRNDSSRDCAVKTGSRLIE